MNTAEYNAAMKKAQEERDDEVRAAHERFRQRAEALRWLVGRNGKSQTSEKAPTKTAPSNRPQAFTGEVAQRVRDAFGSLPTHFTSADVQAYLEKHGERVNPNAVKAAVKRASKTGRIAIVKRGDAMNASVYTLKK